MASLTPVTVLEPGTYPVAGGATVTMTRADLKRLARLANHQARQGIPVPVGRRFADLAGLSADHRRALTASANAGFADRWELDAAGRLVAYVDLPGEAGAALLARGTSPAVELEEDFVDGRGALWPGLSVRQLAFPVDESPATWLPLCPAGRVRLSLSERTEGNVTDATTAADRLRKALAKCEIRIPADLNPADDIDTFVRILTVACENAAQRKNPYGYDPDAVPEPAEEPNSPMMLSLVKGRGTSDQARERALRDDRKCVALERRLTELTIRQIDEMMGR